MNPAVLTLIVRVLIALAIYAFLGILIWGLQRDIRLAGTPKVDLPTAFLIISEYGEGVRSHRLRDVNLIGRSADNTVMIDEETVSSRHARVSYITGQWWLEDLGSKNGTSVNGDPLEEPLIVTYGDIISFGMVDTEFSEVAEIEDGRS
jgi:pSer/pThr/pTyr-binding forkhead associated (FHA) protein